jgi:hypothetical protein
MPELHRASLKVACDLKHFGQLAVGIGQPVEVFRIKRCTAQHEPQSELTEAHFKTYEQRRLGSIPGWPQGDLSTYRRFTD